MTIHKLPPNAPVKPWEDPRKPVVHGEPAQVISIASAQPRQEFVAALQEIAKDLKQSAERLMNLGIGACLEGPLHEWSEAQPVGKVMSFGAADLINSGSPELLALVAAIDELHKCAEVFRASESGGEEQ